MFVLTADQRDSRSSADLVEDAIRALTDAVPAAHRRFERTAGDEVQGVLLEATHCLAAATVLLRDGRWSVGIGVGAVELPLPPSTRAGRGPAFSAAREAVEEAKGRQQRCCVVGVADRTGDADAVLVLTTAVSDRWSEEARAAVQLVESGLTQTEAAERLGVTRQAVGQRLAAALWRPHREATAALQRLLRAADQDSPADGDGDGVDLEGDLDVEGDDGAGAGAGVSDGGAVP